jgi:hypothetical protein
MPAITSPLLCRRIRNRCRIRSTLGLLSCALFFGSLGQGLLSGDSICFSARRGASGLCFA